MGGIKMMGLDLEQEVAMSMYIVDEEQRRDRPQSPSGWPSGPVPCGFRRRGGICWNRVLFL